MDYEWPEGRRRTAEWLNLSLKRTLELKKNFEDLADAPNPDWCRLFFYKGHIMAKVFLIRSFVVELTQYEKTIAVQPGQLIQAHQENHRSSCAWHKLFKKIAFLLYLKKKHTPTPNLFGYDLNLSSFVRELVRNLEYKADNYFHTAEVDLDCSQKTCVFCA